MFIDNKDVFFENIQKTDNELITSEWQLIIGAAARIINLSKLDLGGRFSGNEISHNLWLWLKGHNFTSLISVFGEKGPNKFSQKGNILAFGEVVSDCAHPVDWWRLFIINFVNSAYNFYILHKPCISMTTSENKLLGGCLETL